MNIDRRKMEKEQNQTSTEKQEPTEAEKILGSMPSFYERNNPAVSTEETPDQDDQNLDSPLKERLADFMTHLRSDNPDVVNAEEHDHAARYNHMPTNMEHVVENAEEYIIPENLPACKSLWGKNIDTVQCSNYDDKDRLSIDLGQLSDENMSILQEMIEHGIPGYSITTNITSGQNTIAIAAKTPQGLQKLVESFVLQDVQEGEGYTDASQYLAEFRKLPDGISIGPNEDGWYVDIYGNVGILPEGQGNPNATLEQALAARGDEHLYIPEEGRVYASDFRLEQHKRFLEQK